MLEARLRPPYQGAFGLGSNSAPGLQRLESARFTGEFPLAHIAFRDRRMPVQVSLDAFSPFIPHDADASGLPAAVLRYRVTNPGATPAVVSIAYSLENPLLTFRVPSNKKDPRVSEPRSASGIAGLLLSNPAIGEDNALAGSIGLWVLGAGDGRVTMLRGWPRARWWTSALHFWDDFSDDGELGPESAEPGPVAALCLQRTIAPGAYADFTFVISWRFPNRTPDRCGWDAAPGEDGALIGNYYCTRFADAWDAARYLAEHLDDLESRTRSFAEAIRESTLPAAVKDAATANLSTLVTQTCFRTADGEFHGFEGCDETQRLLSRQLHARLELRDRDGTSLSDLARSLRHAAFGYIDGRRRRHALPAVTARWRRALPTAAADGQMGQIIKVYLDWHLSGDDAFLRELWPRVKRAIEFAWIPAAGTPIATA